MHACIHTGIRANVNAGAKTPGAGPKLPPRQASGTGLQGLSGRMSPVKFPPPPTPPAQEEKVTSLPPPPVARKLTSPFAWLSRGTSKKAESPPPASPRRNTNASVATVGSNSDLTSGKTEQEGGHPAHNRSSQHSLRDRFKFLRMKEEAGISMGDESNTEPGHAGALGGVGEEEQASGITSNPTSPRPGPPARQLTVNPNLAPGTVSGLAAGPAGDTAEPVDWDLWQSVVNEGPAAVARTSPEELNQAIASGIPQAIRGVIWQVLAQSKNEELENIYRELVARGTDKEYTTAKSPQSPNGYANGNGKEKDSNTSSSSSVHSDYSTPTTTTGGSNAPLPSPSIGTDHPEDMTKLQARLAADKKQKDAAVQKLEKTIKRDLGARTSYSKYLMAAGLQDGLFGICKAYALYDENVGYAQGMNFIAMPLLFNVSQFSKKSNKANCS